MGKAGDGNKGKGTPFRHGRTASLHPSYAAAHKTARPDSFSLQNRPRPLIVFSSP